MRQGEDVIYLSVTNIKLVIKLRGRIIKLGKILMKMTKKRSVKNYGKEKGDGNEACRDSRYNKACGIT